MKLKIQYGKNFLIFNYNIMKNNYLFIIIPLVAALSASCSARKIKHSTVDKSEISARETTSKDDSSVVKSNTEALATMDVYAEVIEIEYDVSLPTFSETGRPPIKSEKRTRQVSRLAESVHSTSSSANRVVSEQNTESDKRLDINTSEKESSSIPWVLWVCAGIVIGIVAWLFVRIT